MTHVRKWGESFLFFLKFIYLIAAEEANLFKADDFACLVCSMYGKLHGLGFISSTRKKTSQVSHEFLFLAAIDGVVEEICKNNIDLEVGFLWWAADLHWRFLPFFLSLSSTPQRWMQMKWSDTHPSLSSWWIASWMTFARVRQSVQCTCIHWAFSFSNVHAVIWG